MNRIGIKKTNSSLSEEEVKYCVIFNHYALFITEYFLKGTCCCCLLFSVMIILHFDVMIMMKLYALKLKRLLYKHANMQIRDNKSNTPIK